MEKFIFEYKGFIFTEPNMLLSNWVITIVCLVCVYQLRTIPSTALMRYYRLVFIMNSIGAFLGGLSHFLYHYTGEPFKAFAWISIGIGTYYLQSIAIVFAGKPALKRPLLIFSTVKLILFITFLIYLQSFLIVLADLALGLFLIVIPIHIGHYRKTQNIGSLLMLLAVGVILVSAIFPIFRISLHETWFTFNDIGHIFMAASLYIIYLSATPLVGYPSAVLAQDPGK